MKIPFWFVALCFLAICPAQADTGLRLEVGTGLSQHAKRRDGLWYQSEYPNEHNLRVAAGQIGVSWFPSDWFPPDSRWHMGWRVAYVSLGTSSGSAIALEDEQDRGKGLPCDSQTRRGDCLARFDQQTSVRGLSLGPVFERALGSIVASVEGGAYLGYSKVHAHRTSITSPEQADVDIVTQWVPTPWWYLGAGARYRYVTLDGRMYQNLSASGGFQGPRYAYTLMLGLSIPFK